MQSRVEHAACRERDGAARESADDAITEELKTRGAREVSNELARVEVTKAASFARRDNRLEAL